MSKKKAIEVVVVTFQEYAMDDFVFPSRYMIRNAMGNYIFIKTNKKEVALRYIQDNYNGQYSLREV